MKPDKELEELRSKVNKYEQLLHAIQLHAEVAMDSQRVAKLIENICKWSYAHRVGNGEYSDEEQEKIIKHAFDNLLQ